MVLPNTDRTALEVAIRQFDAEYRSSRGWIGWEKNVAKRFVLVHNGQSYPPKKIISVATGVPVSEFSGGRQSNEYLRRLGFEVVAINNQASGPLDAPNFVIGKEYDRWPEINDLYGGSRQSGISPSKRTPAVFLFTGDTGEQYGYRDDFDADGVFTYTGEGQVGGMQLTKGNRAIATHAADSRALHVFQSLGKGKKQAVHRRVRVRKSHASTRPRSAEE